MAETQEKWRDVIGKMEGLGLKLKLHLEQEKDETNEDAKPGDTKAVLDDLGNRLQEAFAGVGNAAKDQAVKADMKDIGITIKEAMMHTFSTVGAQVEDVVKKAPKTTDSSPETDVQDETASPDPAEASSEEE